MNTLFSTVKSQERVDQSIATAEADTAPKVTEVEAGRRLISVASDDKMTRPDGNPPGGPPPSGPPNGSSGSEKTAYSDSASAIADYLKKLIAEFTTDTAASTSATTSTTSTVSTASASSFSSVINSVNNLFSKNGIAASATTMTDFLQILQTKMQESESSTGNFVDAQV